MIGNHPTDLRFSWNGLIDEPRISSVARSADWIKTEYNNQSSPDSFFALYGTEQQQHPTGSASAVKLGSQGTPALSFKDTAWPYRKKITIDPKKVSGTTGQTNFPMLISRTDPDLRSSASGGKVGRMSGKDIFFTDWEGNKLSHEIETYASSTGQLIAWVKVPFLSSTSTRELYMYYGNGSAANQQDPTNVWTNGYAGVWHLPDGTNLTANDSTSNANNGTLQGSPPPSATPGKVDGPGSFNGSTAYVDVGRGSSMSMRTTFTLNAWVKLSAVAGYQTVVIHGGQGDIGEWWFYLTNGHLSVEVGNGTSHSYNENLTNAIDTNWHHVAITFNLLASTVRGSGNGYVSLCKLWAAGFKIGLADLQIAIFSTSSSEISSSLRS